MGVTAQLLITRFGPTATAALGRMVREAQAADPLSPVDVVVPSALSGVTLRRQIAQPALANVRFGSLPQLAERLARRRMALTGSRPLTASSRGLAVRRAVQSGRGPLAHAAAHPATAAMLEGLFAELDGAAYDVTRLDAITDAGPRGKEVAELYRDYRGACDGLLAGAEILGLAAESVRAADAPETTVVLYAPHRLSEAERGLLSALAADNRLRCVLALTGDGTVDTEDRALGAWLEQHLGPSSSDLEAHRPETTVVLEPDAEEEVRESVREILAFFEKHPVRPERIAVAYRSAVPYARLLEEQLSVAGLPFHVAGGRRLADSAAGRTLLRLLDLRVHDYPRNELLAWLSAGPLLSAAGRPVPLARWDRLSRVAGVSRGQETWQARLDRHAATIQKRRDEVDASAADAEVQWAHQDRRIQDCHELRTFVDDVAAHCDAVAVARTWAGVGVRLRAAITRFLGDPRIADGWAIELHDQRWRQVERTAYDAVLSVVDGLAELDDGGTPPSYAEVRQVLAGELDRPLRSGTTLGRGIAVTRMEDLVGADLDLLVVLGMTEDAFPPRIREHPILGDAARVGSGLLSSSDRRRVERRTFLAATASARRVVLSASKADTRAQRGLHPSPWFMETVAELHGEPVASADLATSPDLLSQAWITRHDSFEQALRETSTPTTTTELDVQLAITGHGDALADVDARYARARVALKDRIKGEFTAWTGHVGSLAEELRERADGRLSASSLQTYATCPRHYLLDRVLAVHDLDDPGDDDVIAGATKGTLVHGVLEAFVQGALPDDGPPPRGGRTPDAAWTTAEIAHAHDLLDSAAADLEAQGLTGRPLLWQAHKARLHRQLTRILQLDSRLRARRHATPVAVEAPFGRDGVPPLALDLPRSGRVELAGSIDRVDRAADGTVIVRDYKTGADYGYDRIPKVEGRPPKETDLVERGRKLQVVLYGLAARRDFGEGTAPVESYYWFVEQDGLHRGGPVDPTAEHRLLEVLDISVEGIRSGVYPGHPGDENWQGGWESCHFCPYDRVCPTTRTEQWEAARAAPPVQPYAAVADPQPNDQQGDETTEEVAR